MYNNCYEIGQHESHYIRIPESESRRTAFKAPTPANASNGPHNQSDPQISFSRPPTLRLNASPLITPRQITVETPNLAMKKYILLSFVFKAKTTHRDEYLCVCVLGFTDCNSACASQATNASDPPVVGRLSSD